MSAIVPYATLPPLSGARTVAGLQTAADTVYMLPIRDSLTTAADVAILTVGAFVVVLILVILFLVAQLRKLNGTVRGVGDRFVDKARPILERGQGVADNVEFISSVVRQDVERLNEAVRALTERLQQASDHMETRIDEFNALVEVVQREAEDLFIDTASTARGVREGVKQLTLEDDVEPSVGISPEPVVEERTD